MKRIGRWLDGLRTQTLAIASLIAVFTAATVVAPHLPHTTLHAQVSNPSIILVASAPSGSCSINLPDQQVIGTGVLYTCQSGTWAIVPGGSSTVSITSSAGGLTMNPSPLTGTGTIDLNLGHANTWTAAQTFNATSVQAATTGTEYQCNVSGCHPFTIINNNTTEESGLNIYDVTNAAAYGTFWGFNDGNVVGLELPGNNGSQASCLSFSNSAYSNGTIDTAACREAAGVWRFNTSNSTTQNGNALLQYAAFQSMGTVFTVSGCGTPTATGGASAGTFAAGSSTCNPVITPGKTATNGWVCVLQDETTSTASFRQSAHSTTTCTLAGTNVADSDVIDVMAAAF